MKIFVAVDVIEQRFLGTVAEVHAADGDRHHFRAGGHVAALHFLEGAVFPGSHDEARAKLAPGDF